MDTKIEIWTNIITSIGVIFGLIFSIITLRQSKKAQIAQQKEVENNRFEENRGILQVFSNLHKISTQKEVEYLVVRNIGRSSLKIIEFLPDEVFLSEEDVHWHKSNLSKEHIWLAPGQSYSYPCNIEAFLNRRKSDLTHFSVKYKYETLGRIFEEEVKGLNYKSRDYVRLTTSNQTGKEILEEIKYQLYIMNSRL